MTSSSPPGYSAEIISTQILDLITIPHQNYRGHRTTPPGYDSPLDKWLRRKPCDWYWILRDGIAGAGPGRELFTEKDPFTNFMYSLSLELWYFDSLKNLPWSNSIEFWQEVYQLVCVGWCLTYPGDPGEA